MVPIVYANSGGRDSTTLFIRPRVAIPEPIPILLFTFALLSGELSKSAMLIWETFAVPPLGIVVGVRLTGGDISVGGFREEGGFVGEEFFVVVVEVPGL